MHQENPHRNNTPCDSTDENTCFWCYRQITTCNKERGKYDPNSDNTNTNKYCEAGEVKGQGQCRQCKKLSKSTHEAFDTSNQQQSS